MYSRGVSKGPQAILLRIKAHTDQAPMIQGSINSRINILYFLDSLCETCLLAKSHPSALGAEANANGSFYVDFVARDLKMIVECVVPEGRHGLPNLTSTKQVSMAYIT